MSDTGRNGASYSQLFISYGGYYRGPARYWVGLPYAEDSGGCGSCPVAQ